MRLRHAPLTFGLSCACRMRRRSRRRPRNACSQRRSQRWKTCVSLHKSGRYPESRGRTEPKPRIAENLAARIQHACSPSMPIDRKQFQVRPTGRANVLHLSRGRALALGWRLRHRLEMFVSSLPRIRAAMCSWPSPERLLQLLRYGELLRRHTARACRASVPSS